MVDCAVMGIEWRDQTWWQYQACLAVWNRRNAPSDPKTPPSIPPAHADRMRQVLALN